MRTFGLAVSVVFVAAFFFAASAVNGQVERPLQNERRADKNPRPSLLNELDLSPEQVAAIRRINRENQFSIRQAQQRLREANRNLDSAIYADSIDETEIQARLREAQNAQIEVVKNRTARELAVRKLLTAQQLERFRDLRQKFADDAVSRPDTGRGRQLRDFSNRQLNKRQRQATPND